MSQHARNNPDAPTVHNFFAGSGCIRTSSIVGTGRLTIEARSLDTTLKWIEIADTVARLAADGRTDAHQELHRMATLADQSKELLRQRDELLAALQDNLEAIETHFTCEAEKFPSDSQHVVKGLAQIRAAIARAKGEATASDLSTVCQSDTGKAALSKMEAQE